LSEGGAVSGFFGYARLGPQHYRERFGLSFEEFETGQVFEHRPGVDVTQQDNLEEALDTINNAQLHYDARYAGQTEWKRNLVVSTVTLQRVLGMTSRTFYRRRNLLGLDEIAMTRPVFGGDTLYAHTRVIGKNDTGDPDVGVLSLVTAGLNQRRETVAGISYQIEVFRFGRHPEDRDLPVIAGEERFRLHHPGEDGALVEQTGLYFEDFIEGESFEHWPGKSISGSESRVHALRSLEINPRFASAMPDIFEPFVIGAVTALTTRTFGRVVANLGWTDVALPRPVRPGETIRAKSKIAGKRESAKRPDQGILQVETSAYGEDGTPVCRFGRTLLVYKRGLGPYHKAGY